MNKRVFDNHYGVTTQAIAHWARALAHPTRVAVLRELATVDVASPQVLARRLDQPLGPVAYHVRTLRRWRVVELTGTTHRRGAIEHHYRLTDSAAPIIREMLSMNAVAEDEPWSRGDFSASDWADPEIEPITGG